MANLNGASSPTQVASYVSTTVYYLVASGQVGSYNRPASGQLWPRGNR